MKNAYRRDPLDALRAKGHRDRLDRIRNSMTPAEVEAAMAKIIRTKLEQEEDIREDDFRLANLPMDQVKTIFRRVLRTVQNGIASERA
jgi:hypothetical protein